MPDYGTTAGLELELQPDPLPDHAQALLRLASGLVLDAAGGAVYSTDADGRARDPRIVAALDRAAEIQAAAWIVAGVDPRKGRQQLGRQIASKTLGSKSVTYVADPQADADAAALASGDQLVAAAWREIANAGLTTTRVQTSPADHHPVGVAHVYTRQVGWWPGD